MRPGLSVVLISLMGCGGPRHPLDGDWLGSMDVALADDVRTFTIEVTDIVRWPTCEEDPDFEEGCIEMLWTGAWEPYCGDVAYGGDADLTGKISFTHCVGSDCVGTDVTGAEVPLPEGYFTGYSSWPDGQSIGMLGMAEGDDIEAIDGTATYGYSGGQMSGSFEIERK